MSSSVQEVGARLEWIDFDAAPIVFANHFLVQHQPDESFSRSGR